ncbi:MAG: DNA primase [Nitriliruptorales bacterium]|nr:DNA primase [Nitriliruptorales bacterium]
MSAVAGREPQGVPPCGLDVVHRPVAGRFLVLRPSARAVVEGPPPPVVQHQAVELGRGRRVGHQAVACLRQSPTHVTRSQQSGSPQTPAHVLDDGGVRVEIVRQCIQCRLARLETLQQPQPVCRQQQPSQSVAKRQPLPGALVVRLERKWFVHSTRHYAAPSRSARIHAAYTRPSASGGRDLLAGRINEDDIRTLRERADIAAVVGDYTSLKRAGGRLKGLCPFHEERTPSFTVDPTHNLFHCFGCDEGGDVISFLQKIESLTFPEAVERLSRLSNFPLRYEELSPGQRKALGRRTRLTDALVAAATFYRTQLEGPDGEAARQYLAGRGLTRDDAQRFGLGWAPDRWDGLVRHLAQEGFEHSEISDAGLATIGRQGLTDRFRGRVVFPIYDAGGKDVVAFGGRILPDVQLKTGPREGQPPKYINSSESAVYKKSHTLYALNWARSEITRRQVALVVEGYMDVIALHRLGVRHAVATCGTALTTDHFRALEKFAPRVVLALDADAAGFAAAERARSLAEEVGLREVSVLPLPEGRDPADLADEGVDAVEAALHGTKTAVEFQIEHLLRGADTATPEGQTATYRATFPLLVRLPDRVLRYRYIRDLVAPAVRLSADRIEQELDAEVTAARGRGSAPAVPEPAPARRAPGDVTGGEPSDPQLILEREVLRTALQHPQLLPSAWKLVTAEDFRAPLSRTLFEAMSDVQLEDLGAVLAALPDDAMRSRVRALAMSESRVEPDAGHVAELVARLRAAAVEREVGSLRDDMTRLGEQLGPEDRRRYVTAFEELERRRRTLLEGSDH